MPLQHTAHIQSVLAQHPSIIRARIFGSRALGNWKPSSGVDLALEGQEGRPLDVHVVDALTFTLSEEGTLPYMFDIIDRARITNPALEAHIAQHGRIFYERA
jgi:predicted nucleotidyltransferase